MTKRIILSSYCNGYNFGSVLQCYALKTFLENCNFEVDLISKKTSIFQKAVIAFKNLFRFKYFLKQIKASSLAKKMITREQYLIFNNDFKKLNINYLKFGDAKRIAKNSSCCVCGSDQIWNSESLYLNPFYFLAFSPKNKNIAYAPSLGRNYIPNFNRKKMRQYLGNIRFLSTREELNCDLLSKLCSQYVKFVCDPVFLFSQEEWIKITNFSSFRAGYILCYFLDKPTEDVGRKIIEELNKKKKNVLFVGNSFSAYKNFFKFNYEFINISSFSFPSLIFDSDFVYTDSFHGLAFSIIGKKRIKLFDRNYIAGKTQNIRISSLLKSLDITIEDNFIHYSDHTFSLLDKIIIDSKNYLKKSVDTIYNEQY